jgi:hemolysin activation/secretion protein
MKLFLNRGLIGCALAALVVPMAAADVLDDPVGTFEIGRFEVAGDTQLGARSIAQLLSPWTGNSRRFSDVQQAMQSLEDAYRARGYKLVRVMLPEQELNHGTVRLVVVQPRIGTVQVEGNTGFSDANIRRSLPGLREGESPNLNAISSSLRLANESPAKKTTLSLQNAAGGDEVNAILQVVDEKPWVAGVVMDNAGSEQTGRTQLTTQFQYANIADLDHTLSMQFTTTLEQSSKVGVYGVGYHIPLYAWGGALDFYGSHSDVNSGQVSAGAFNLQISGKGTVLGSRYTHNLTGPGDYSAKLSVGLEQKAFQNNVSYQGVQLGNDVTVRPLSLTYAADWTLPAARTSYYVSAAGNIPGGDHGNDSDFARLRTGATSGYGVLRYGLNHLRELPADWQLRVALNGQISRDSLVPGEQFGAGGAASVRGYMDRIIADDQGVMANLEVYTPSLCRGEGAQCRMLAFFDTARVTRNNPLPSERADATISSAGIGVRLAVGRLMTAQMDVGQVLADGSGQSRGDTRVHLKMNLSY